MSEISNHAGLCSICRKWADAISGGNMVVQLQIGKFAETYGHRQTHFELQRLFKINQGIWKSLSSFVGIEPS